MRIALNSWLNCPFADGQPQSVCKSRHNDEHMCHNARRQACPAKERVMALEASNDSLKVQLGKRTDSVTKQKLQEAQQMLEEKLLTSNDFAAIKQKYMQENFGVSADK